MRQDPSVQIIPLLKRLACAIWIGQTGWFVEPRKSLIILTPLCGGSKTRALGCSKVVDIQILVFSLMWSIVNFQIGAIKSQRVCGYPLRCPRFATGYVIHTLVPK